MRLFKDRTDAGRAVAQRLRAYAGQPDLLVLGLPRGGVPVAYEVAKALKAELDVLIVRKLGVPSQPEVAMGAIASGGALSVNDSVIQSAGVTPRQFEMVHAAETTELQRREQTFRGNRPPIRVHGRTVIVVDDGFATGATMRVALAALRRLEPAHLIAATPVAPPEAAEQMRGLADEFVCVSAPPMFSSVGQQYEKFDQTPDNEVRDLLDRAQQESA